MDGADMQQRPLADLLDAELCGRQGRDARLAGIETEALSQGVRRGAQKSDGGMQRLTQVRSHVDLAQSEGCGGNGMTQTEQKEDGLEVHRGR